MIGLHFVATGRMSRELGRCFSLLFERRHSSDYDDFAYSSEEEIDELMPKATDFIGAIEVLLRSQTLESCYHHSYAHLPGSKHLI